jgi:hypothetical protein
MRSLFDHLHVRGLLPETSGVSKGDIMKTPTAARLPQRHRELKHSDTAIFCR